MAQSGIMMEGESDPKMVPQEKRRAHLMAFLARHRGKAVRTLTPAERDALLDLLAMLAGVVNDAGFIG